MTDRIVSIAEHLARKRRQLEREEVERRLNRWPKPERRPTLSETLGWPEPPPAGDAA